MRIKQKGQGLIETLIVVLFISVSIVAFMSFQRYLSANTSFSQQQSTAALITMNQIETLRDYQAFNTTAGLNAYQDINSGTSNITSGNTSYTLTWTVTAFTNPTYKKIDVVTTWTDRNGVNRSLRLITNVAGIEPALEAAII